MDSTIVDDVLEEAAFTDQIQVTGEEQAAFDRNLEQLEQYLEDQLLVLRRRLMAARKSLRAAQDRRDSALGSELRSQAEARVLTIQQGIDGIESEVGRLEKRDDPEYQRWRQRVQQRRDNAPVIQRIFDLEFVLE
jgi:hypothetical protein